MFCVYISLLVLYVPPSNPNHVADFSVQSLSHTAHGDAPMLCPGWVVSLGPRCVEEFRRDKVPSYQGGRAEAAAASSLSMLSKVALAATATRFACTQISRRKLGSSHRAKITNPFANTSLWEKRMSQPQVPRRNFSAAHGFPAPKFARAAPHTRSACLSADHYKQL